MSVPTKRLARRKKHNRRSHFAMKKVILTQCPKCKKATLPHRACASCGYYRDRKVVVRELPQIKKMRKAQKAAKKQEKAEAADEKNNKKGGKPEQKITSAKA